MNSVINDFYNIDVNTRILYIFLFVVFIILYNFSINLTNKIFICLIVFYLIFTKHTEYMNKTIESYNNFSEFNDFVYVKKNISIASIYYKLLKFKDIDRYNYFDSLENCNMFLKLHSEFLSNKNKNYQIDILNDYKNNILNYLKAIVYSITPTTGYITNNKFINNPLELELDNYIIGLKTILDSMMFDIYNSARIDYETNDINNNSMPIYFDKNEPLPNDKTLDVFNYYNNLIVF